MGEEVKNRGSKNKIAFIAMIILFLSTFTLSIIDGGEGWYFSLIFLFIAIVVIPLLKYLNKKEILI
mgnify:CR=1 FL=1